MEINNKGILIVDTKNKGILSVELIIKEILIVDIHNTEILIVDIRTARHPPHHPATHTDIHASRCGGGPRAKSHKEQK